MVSYTLRATTLGTQPYDIGDNVVLQGQFSYGDDIAIDPALVQLRIKSPSGLLASYVYLVDVELESEEAGKYTLVLEVNEAGNYWYRFESQGVVQEADENWFQVKESQFTTWV